jgi:hypothetical protein
VEISFVDAALSWRGFGLRFAEIQARIVQNSIEIAPSLRSVQR